MCTSPLKKSSDTPEWTKHAVWYQIFVERFNNGDTTNDPAPQNIHAESNFYEVPDDWGITPWTGNWYKTDPWAEDLEGDFYARIQLRRYGGDLRGVIEKLDYLQVLGVNAIYFNPLNDAPSLHKYDARNYRHIDVNFGPDPEGDNEIIASEDPEDPSTWKWTSADRMFLDLVKEMHKRGMKVILDYSWNHTGVEFWAWKDIVKNQQDSPYKDWYSIVSFDDPSTKKNEFDYKGWLNLKSLPEIKKVDTEGRHEYGHPYEGDINEGAKQHIFAVTERWLSPDGNIENGIDGFRLDVADHVPMGFWRDYHSFVKSINPDAYLVGEIWWEDYPDKLMDPVPYTNGDVFDAVMFYQVYRPARSFFGNMKNSIDAQQFKDSLEYQWVRLREPVRYAMMNVAATHDSPRLLTSFYNKGKYKYRAKPNDDPEYKTGKPDEVTFRRVKLYLVHQFTSIGAPHIWNGDEMGMWGADDPDCRKPLWWDEYEFDPEPRGNFLDPGEPYSEVGFDDEHYEYYKKLIDIRNGNRVLRTGQLEFLEAEGKKLYYRRYSGDDEIFVMFNLGKTETTYELPDNGLWMNLLNGDLDLGKDITLGPLSAAIIKRQP